MKLKILGHFTDYAGYPERRKLNTFGGIGYYRMHKPAQQIKDHQIDVRGVDIDKYGDTFLSNWENIFKEYDVFWAVHSFSEQNSVAQCFFADKYKKVLIYDLDDNYLDLDESNPVYEKFFTKKKGKYVSSRNKSILTAALSLADAMTVSTEPLKERFQKHFKEAFNIEKPIFVLPNMNDVEDWKYEMTPKYPDRVVIGYAGSMSHKKDLQMVFPAIHNLMKRLPNLYFEILGSIDKHEVNEYFDGWDLELLDRVAMVPATKIFNEYPKWLSQQKWDIAIAPLIDTPFTRSKSHIKWMEYSMFKIPVVASRVYPYFMELQGRKTIVDGETGFLCRPPEWGATLERLIFNKELREKVGMQAYEAVKHDWQYKDSSINDEFGKFLVQLAEAKKPRSRPRTSK